MPKPRSEKSSKEYGRELEQYIANKFIELGFNDARPTKGSGSVNGDGDITGVGSTAHVECKHTNTENVTIKESVWKKLNSEIPLHSKKIPMYALQNNNNMRLICLDVDDFFSILEGYLVCKQVNEGY